jgi:AraC-like DNA-binding protein
MIRIHELLPSALLRDYVRSYHYAEMRLGEATLVKPLTARPEQMLQFSLARPFSVTDRATARATDAPDVALVGRQTRRNLDLAVTGDVITLTVHFQPAGFYRLFHMPMSHLTNQWSDAVDVIGADARRLHERIAESSTPEAMVAHVESVLATRLEASRPEHPVQRAAASFLNGGAPNDIAALAAASELSVRQFQRAFTEQVGVGPKLFGRIVRFAAALQCKSDAPHRSWADIAAAAGYFDQMHFIRDCRSFGGDTPSSLIETWIDCRP